MKIGSILAFSLLFAAGSAAANDGLNGLWSKQEFETNRTNVTKALADHDDKYKELSGADQKKVAETLDRMEERWQKAGDSGTLSGADQVAMANDQTLVTATLSQASADSRVVCERVQQIGSNLPKNVCKTAGQRRREMIEAQNAAQAGKVEGN